MYKHILIATDGSELATKALEHGLALAKQDNAHVTVVTVTEPWAPLDMAHEARQHRPDPIGHFEEMATAAANRILDGAAQRGNAHGVTCDVVHVKDQHPAEGPDIAGMVLMSGRYHFDPKPDDPNLKNFQAYFGTDAGRYPALIEPR